MRGHERFKALREARGLSQAELARKAGLYPADICTFENSRKPIPRHHAPALAKVLGVDEDFTLWVLGYAPEDLRGIDEQDFLDGMKLIRARTGRWKRM